MRLLLDTHVLLWWLDDAPTLSEPARRAITDAAAILVSSASVWEIAIKRASGKLRLPPEFLGHVAGAGFELLDVTADHALETAELPLHHRDPFDRMLVAQARAERLTLVTRDRRLGLYDVPVIAA